MPDELTRLCAELPGLRAALRDRPDLRVLLDRAERAALDGEPVRPLLEAMGITFGDGRDVGSPLPVTSHTVRGVYLCPVHRCQRAETRTPSGELPTCHLFGRSLSFAPDGR